MAEDIASLAIKVDALQTRIASVELDKLTEAGKRTEKSIGATEKAAKLLGVTMDGARNFIGAFGISLGAIGIAALTKGIIDTNREMESLRARLLAVTGSAQNAKEAFQFIKDFAINTPFEISDLTKSFINLQNFGIKPTTQVMEALTNQAAKSGASAQNLEGITLALGRAWANGKLQGEEIVQLIYQSVPVYELLARVTGKNRSELSEMSEKGLITRDVISKLITEMGNLARGSNAAAMDTLNGKISNLSDAWHNFEDTLLNDKSEGFLRSIVTNMTEMIEGLSIVMSNTLEDQLASANAKIEAFRQGNLFEKGIARISGFDIDTEVAKANLLRAQIGLENDYKAAKEASAVADQKHEDIQSTHTTKHKARRSAMSEEQKAAQSLAREFENLSKNLEKELALALVSGDNRKLAALDYDLQNGSLRKLNIAKKEYLFGLQQEINARELEAKGNEAKKQELDSLIDRYNRLTLSAIDYFKLTLTTKGIAPDQQGQLIGQFQKVQGAEAEKQKIDAAKDAVKSYSEEIDKASDSLSALRDISSSVFDGALGGINLLIGAVDNITKSLKENQAAMEENQKAIGFAKLTKDLEAQEKFKKQDLKLTQEKTAREVDGARQIAGATAKLFGEKTSAAKSFHALEIALSVASIAMRAKEMAATLAQTVISVAAGAAKFFEQSGWFGFAGVAGMIAVMASLGFGSRGGGTVSAPATGTGTILGDKTATSESTSKTYQLLKDIHAEEYAELRGINQGIRNLNGAINDTITRIFQAGGINAAPVNGLGLKGSALGSLADPVSSFLRDIPVIGGFIGGIQDFVFGSTKKSIEAFGIQLGKIDIAKILEGAIVDAQQFTTVKTIKKGALGGLFGGNKTSFEDILSPLDKGVTDNLTAIFKNVGLVMVDVAKALGGNLEKSVRQYILPAVKIDLKDLSGEEALKKLTGVISAQLDNMASSVFGKIVGKYQKLGEGMLETAIRIVAEVAVVRDALGKSGLKMAKDAIALSDALVQAAGGIQEFQKQFGDFYDKFFTDIEKQRDLQRSLAAQLKEVGEILPKTRQGYRALLESLDLNNKKDQERYTLLLKLSSAADKFYKRIEELQSESFDRLSDAISKTREAIGNTVSYIKSIVDSLTNASNAIKQNAIGDTLGDRVAAFNQLQNILSGVNKGVAVKKPELDTILATLTKPSQQFFKTAEDFKRDAFRTAGVITDLSIIGKKQITDREKQLKLLENIQSAAKKQIDAINGVSTAVYSVRSALLLFKNAIGPVAAKKIPKFASGGYHEGGFAIVGEDGPELVNMPAGRIFSNTSSRKMVDNSELINEIRELRNEVRFLRASSEETARNSRKTSDTLTRVTRDGDSLLTTAA